MPRHRRSPKPVAVATQTLQAVALSILSNIIAQIISHHRHSTPFDLSRTFQFALFTLLNTPPNILWQAFLEDCFPAYVQKPRVVHIDRSTRSTDFQDLAEVSGAETEKGEDERKNAKEELGRWEKTRGQWREEVSYEPQLSRMNTAYKLVLDQTLGALVNTIIFLAATAYLRGDDPLTAVKTKTWGIMAAGYKLWPAVSLLSFTVIPLERRVLFGSAVGVGWGVWLSLIG